MIYYQKCFINKWEKIGKVGLISKGGRATLAMLRRKSKTQFVNQERNTQNAIALFNYLKRIAPLQKMLRMQAFTKKIVSAKNASTI